VGALVLTGKEKRVFWAWARRKCVNWKKHVSRGPENCIRSQFMLNLSVAMKNLVTALILFWLAGPLALLAQQVVVDSPRPGEALQGQVTITGTTDVEGLESYEVSFAYQKDETNTWFPIATGDQALRNGALATWDTTTITDGTYRLRIRTFLADGRTLETVVSGLRVRNYTPVETNTPADTPQAQGSATVTPLTDETPAQATITPLADNPAMLTSTMLGDSLVKGGLAALALFVVLFLYVGIRGLFRKGR
jgi:hypothetical protein